MQDLSRDTVHARGSNTSLLGRMLQTLVLFFLWQEPTFCDIRRLSSYSKINVRTYTECGRVVLGKLPPQGCTQRA